MTVLGLEVALVAFAVLAYYRFVVSSIGEWLARRTLAMAIGRLSVARTWEVDGLDSVARLGIAGLLQLLFCVALLGFVGVDEALLQHLHLQPALIAAGAALGLTEAALASFVGNVAMRVSIAATPDRVPETAREWVTMAKGGWMRLYAKTAEVAPLSLVIALTLLYVAVEETVFRGVLIMAFDDLGAAAAIALSTALFVVVQTFHMPSWQSAVFPVAGALVVGTVHGVLFVETGDLTPLIVAHFVLFLSALA